LRQLLKLNTRQWDLFTKHEEYILPIRDRFNRFPSYLSSNRNIFEPEVSRFLIENGLKIDYPDNRKFGVCLTHDIDSIYFSNKEIIIGVAKLLIHGKIQHALRQPFQNINKKWNHLRDFETIIGLEQKYGAKSSFYFLALTKGNLDFNYNVEDLAYELNYITDAGCEVGLHGGHEASNNLNAITEEKQRLEKVLGKKVIGYRNHYLKFEVPNTWELLSKAGFKYDTTFGYADCAGFRNGMCHPFKPYDIIKDADINILEIPLIIMDRTLFDYMKLDFKGAWAIAKMLIDATEKYHGVITILWHNTYMTNENLKFYEKILKYCYGKKAWMTSGEEICNYWNTNV